MKHFLDNKTVAIVGNAESLFGHSFGKEIDSHDTIIRINRSAAICFKDTYPDLDLTHGTKTDIWAFSFADTMKRELEMYHTVTDKLIQMNPSTKNKLQYPFNFNCISKEDIIEINRNFNIFKEMKNKEYVDQQIEKNNSKYEFIKKHRQYLLRNMKNKILINYKKNYKVSTGLRVLNWISQFNPVSVDVYGFDWKKTPTFYDKLKETRFTKERHGHNYFLEMDYCKEIFENELGYKFIIKDFNEGLV